MNLRILLLLLATLTTLIAADSDGDGIDDTLDEGKMVFHAAVTLGDITYSDYGGSSEAEEFLTNLSRATVHWYGEFNQSDLNKYTNNVNFQMFEMSGPQKAYIVIVGSGDPTLDGTYYFDEYWGELNLSSRQDSSEIYFESQVEINGNVVSIESPRFRFSQNIFNSKLESIIGLPYTIEPQSLTIDVMMFGDSFVDATVTVQPLAQAGSIYYTTLADVQSFDSNTSIDVFLYVSPDEDGDDVSDAFDFYPNDPSETAEADSDGDGIDDTLDEGKMVFHAAVTLGDITYSDYGGSSEAEEFLTNLSRATVHWYGEFNQSDLNKYTNNVNFQMFEMSGPQKAYIVIVGSGDPTLDGTYYFDEYWGELNLSSRQDSSEIYFESQVEINGNVVSIESPRFRFSQNIFNSKLESIIGLPYTIEPQSLTIDVMMFGDSFVDATVTVQPLAQAGSIYYTTLADVQSFDSNTSIDVFLYVSPDEDGDDVSDAFDFYPNDPSETAEADSDLDGDGVGDSTDAFPNDASETVDSDGDGVGDNADAFPNDPTETVDGDGDGVGDNADAFPSDSSEALDSDGDGVGDNADAFPNDASETLDSDGDGVGNNADAFPNDASETLDSDGDEVGDNADAFPNDATESADTDEDGVGDSADNFPNDPSETLDSDGDGVGDNTDDYPNDATESADTDGDGVGDSADLWPLDNTRTLDRDNDGIADEYEIYSYEYVSFSGYSWRNSVALTYDNSNNSNPDIDNYNQLGGYTVISKGSNTNYDGRPYSDGEVLFKLIGPDGDFPQGGSGYYYYATDRRTQGSGFAVYFVSDTEDFDGDSVLNELDAFPYDVSETADSDNDGYGDNIDTDDDNDGTIDELDTFPYDSSETEDSDNDGVGDNADTDDDNDGTTDNLDAFPYDYSEDTDTDSDGVGNNADFDDDGDGIDDQSDNAPLVYNPGQEDSDGDGVPDVQDNAPFVNNPNQEDTDGDGLGDVLDTDDDNDNLSDNKELLLGTDPLVAESPETLLSVINLADFSTIGGVSQEDYDLMISERDLAISERDAKLSIDEVSDLRAGSTMIAVENGTATLSMEVEQSSDLGIWTTGGTASVQMNVQPGEDKKFFRFKMTE